MEKFFGIADRFGSILQKKLDVATPASDESPNSAG